jgi:hypothetical protein
VAFDLASEVVGRETRRSGADGQHDAAVCPDRERTPVLAATCAPAFAMFGPVVGSTSDVGVALIGPDAGVPVVDVVDLGRPDLHGAAVV